MLIKILKKEPWRLKEVDAYKKMFDRACTLLNIEYKDLVLLRDDDYEYERNFSRFGVYKSIMNFPVVFRAKVPTKKMTKAYINIYRRGNSTGKFLSITLKNHTYILTSWNCYETARSYLKADLRKEVPYSNCFKEMKALLEKTFEISSINNIEIRENFDPFRGGCIGFTLDFWCNGIPKKFGNLCKPGRVTRLERRKGYWKEFGEKKWRLTETKEWLTEEIIKVLKRNSFPLAFKGLKQKGNLVYLNDMPICRYLIKVLDHYKPEAEAYEYWTR